MAHQGTTSQQNDGSAAQDTSGEPQPVRREHLAKIPLSELPSWIENLGMDLKQMGGTKQSKTKIKPFLVESISVGRNERKDLVNLRARVLCIRQNPEAEESEVAKAIRNKHSITRTVFACRGYDGFCRINGQACPMEIRVTVYADDLSNAVVTTTNCHPPPPAGSVKLRASAVLREEAYNYFHLGHATPSEFVFDYQTDSRFASVDKRRFLSRSQLKGISSIVRRNKFGKASYDTLRKLAAQDPEHVFAIDVPEDGHENPISQANSLFSFGITDDLGLADAIRLGHQGICGMDTSWRRKSSQNAPLTFLASIDPVSRRAKPIAALFSSNIHAVTLAQFLTWACGRIKSYACRLGALDPSQWPAELRGFGDRIGDCAQGLWMPHVFEIDKSRAEFNAIRAVLGNDVLIRLCFFHLIQAILKWQGSVAEASDSDEAGATDEEEAEAMPLDTVVPKSIRKKLVPAFLSVARSATKEAFEAAKADFLENAIHTIVASDSGVVASVMVAPMEQAIKRYFERNWFTDVWEGTFSDHLVPRTISLGDVNTNNTLESLFKMVDR